MIRAIIAFAAVSLPHIAAAQTPHPDLDPLQNIDTSAFLPGNCAPVRVMADFMYVIECGDNNPVISFISGMAPKYAIDFVQSDDIDAACEKTHGCISADPLSYGEWTGGRDFHEGEFGNVSHTVLTTENGGKFEITSRDTDDATALHNADIALEFARQLILCPDADCDNE